MLYHHTLDVSTSRTLGELPWPSLLCFPLQIFSCFPNSSCQIRQPTIRDEFSQKNFVPEQHLVQEWRLQHFLGVPPSTANCGGHLGDSGMHSSNSCGSMPHACKSPLVQCRTRKRGTKTLLAETFWVSLLAELCHLPAQSICPKPLLGSGLQSSSSYSGTITPLYP